MKIHHDNLVSDQLKKTGNLNEFFTWARDMVMWYRSKDALLWQLSIDHEMDLEYHITEV